MTGQLQWLDEAKQHPGWVDFYDFCTSNNQSKSTKVLESSLRKWDWEVFKSGWEASKNEYK